MSEALVLAAAIVVGVDGRLIALAAGAVWAPVATLPAVAAAALWGRREAARARAGRDAAFVEAVIGELRAGASTRAALRAACSGLPEAGAVVRRLDLGRPLDEAVSGLGALLPVTGRLVEAAVAAGAGGGRMLSVFEELAALAAGEEDAAAELRTALAPVKASMTVLVGVPVVYLAWSLLTGRLAQLLSLPGGGWLTLVGGILFGAGVVSMLVLARSGR